MNEEPAKTSKWNMSKGGRNLALLGIISIIVALATTGISLAIYHNSGDIYLDRSRPGFLPEEDDENTKDPVPEEYSFDRTGKLTMGDIEEYLKNLEVDTNAIDSYTKPFSSEVLSDENLGITEKSN